MLNAEPTADDGEIDANSASTTANSLKCDDCGRFFRNADAAQMHAEKSGHQNFSESTEKIKPLTGPDMHFFVSVIPMYRGGEEKET
jgi:hypothetical protein